MSAEQTFSTADLRGNAQDYKRDATRKHKWALGATQGVGRAEHKPRPQRPAETHYNYTRRIRGAAVANLHHGAKMTRKIDALEGTAVSDASESNSDDGFGMPSPAVEPTPVYSFDAARSPSQGSQILNAALAKAVEKFEERETDKLVKNEYDVLDVDGEVVEAAKGKKGKTKTKAAEPVVGGDVEEDYEFV
ncbi:hypothetical protein AMS68_001304 [Peltaster fructicola]|uniref:Uncharacterized protein n=1 Tax=Peltaster fructicola TaxID=286661 RepID=A0A6H0XM07_9PEZI|nr:hypothetical protein AMS68_001304 [Peltaster fructicola]